MLLISYVLKPGIHGLGLYANDFIPKETVVYQEEPGFLMVITEKNSSYLAC